MDDKADFLTELEKNISSERPLTFAIDKPQPQTPSPSVTGNIHKIDSQHTPTQTITTNVSKTVFFYRSIIKPIISNTINFQYIEIILFLLSIILSTAAVIKAVLYDQLSHLVISLIFQTGIVASFLLLPFTKKQSKPD